jgi:CTP-dependent riboflavin kinase
MSALESVGLGLIVYRTKTHGRGAGTSGYDMTGLNARPDQAQFKWLEENGYIERRDRANRGQMLRATQKAIAEFPELTISYEDL